MTAVRVKLPAKLVPVFEGKADVRGSYGGRGSGKTRNFAKMTAIRTHMWDMAGREGQILCGRQFMNSLADSSLEEIKAAIRSESWLLPHFDIGEKYIRTKSGRIYYTFSGLDRSLDSIKSKARILLGWVDEAEPVSEEAWIKLIPTLREEDSELWVTWNPQSRRAPVHKRFREVKDPLFKIAEMNWRDNPYFPAKLDRDRLRDLRDRPEQYKHIWEGDFAKVVDGAYFAKLLLAAEEQGRIGQFGQDPIMRIRTFWDLGGRGQRSDATSVWVAQWVDGAIVLLDYYEAVGQTVGAHINWLRARGYDDALCYLPHDGEPRTPIADQSWQTMLEQAGFDVEIVPNQGAGAARMRIEAARRRLPICRFNKTACEPGLEALSNYHEKIDQERGVGLGPEHDWSSHCADAFGMMCQVYEPPRKQIKMPVPETDWVI